MAGNRLRLSSKEGADREHEGPGSSGTFSFAVLSFRALEVFKEVSEQSRECFLRHWYVSKGRSLRGLDRNDSSGRQDLACEV